MPLPTFATLDEVPEPFRDAYHEENGEWVPKDEGGGGADDGPTQADLDALKEAASKERDATARAEKARKAAEARAKELERKIAAAEHGVDMDAPEVKQWREQAYKEIRADVEKQFAETPLSDLPENWAARQEAQSALDENRSLKLDNHVKGLALKNGVQKDKVDDWWALNSGRFDLDDQGQPTVKDGKGKPPEQFIADDLKKERPYLYEGSKADGGGAGGLKTGGPGTRLSFEDFSKLQPADKLAAAREAEGR